jgi:hypothetical protein
MNLKKGKGQRVAKKLIIFRFEVNKNWTIAAPLVVLLLFIFFHGFQISFVNCIVWDRIIIVTFFFI